MQIIKIKTPQKQFLANYLRGTGRTLTEFEARQFFRIENLRARMSELRQEGLVVRTIDTDRGTAYAVSARDANGSRARRELA